ncbi:MAG: translational machinery protein [Burkholderiaceae bacterium]|nr:translational machinery protein [Burkholderiaceae bacterium]
MSLSHVVVWLDHAQAHIIHFNRDTAETAVLKSGAVNAHLHTKSAGGSGHAAENIGYLNEIAAHVKEALEILIVGPGQEKMTLIKHLQKQHHAVAEKVVGVETVDHPSDGQLLAWARKYFVKIDNMLGTA